MFRTCFPSIIRSSRLYIQQQAYVKHILLSASRQQYLFGCCMYSLELLLMDGKPSETCRVSFQNKVK